MISALRKIEGRGELVGATSAVMELCLDNPREGFADLFATHPSVESRVRALVRYAGGHYIGPLALPKPPSEAQPNETDQSESGQLPPPLLSGPWGSPTPPASIASDGSALSHTPWGNPARVPGAGTRA